MAEADASEHAAASLRGNWRVYACRHVQERRCGVLTVYFGCDEDDDEDYLSAHCGQEGPDEFVVMAWGCLLAMDPTLRAVDEMLELVEDTWFTRVSIEAPWVVEPEQADEAAAGQVPFPS